MVDNEPQKEINESRRKYLLILYYFAAFFLPSIFLFLLFNRNYDSIHIIFTHIVILAGVLGVVGSIVFFILSILFRSAESALLLCAISWVGFWLFEQLYSIVIMLFPALWRRYFFIALVVVLLCLIVVFWKKKPQFTKVQPVFFALAVWIIVLFVFNIIPGINREIMLYRARGARIEADDRYSLFKRDFIVDEALSSPNIHWLLADGMLSMETVEWYWGVCQDSFREELTQRGFSIYESATLNSGGTWKAIPALLSPQFYDNYWGDILDKAEAQIELDALDPNPFLFDQLSQVGLTMQCVNSYYELIGALSTRGYEVKGIDSDNPVMGTSFLQRILYRTRDLPYLLNNTTPLDFDLLDRIIRVDTHTVTGYESSPRFTLQWFWYTHMGVVAQTADPTITEYDHTAIHVYHLAYEHLQQELLYVIDDILADDPNAVIVIQADHGFHLMGTLEFLVELGYDLDKILELRNSVFSAARIPEVYGGLAAPLSPLNVTRELVNRFVGHNYDLLP